MTAAWFVPGRLEVFGKHTDYAGGNVLVAAVDLGVTVTARRAPGRGFVATSEHGDPVELDPAAPDALAPGHWGRYVHTALARLTRDFGPLPPAAIHVASTLPLASGMSSSSALLTGVALAMMDLAGIDRPDGLATYLASMETGVGTHGGSEDHCAILHGVDGRLLHFGFDPLGLRDTVALPDGWRFVVATSGVAAEKSGAALADYNRCSALARDIVARSAVATSRPLPHLAAALRELGADDVRALVADSAALSRRLEHFLVESDHVVPSAIRALVAGDAAGFGAVAARSQRAAEELLGNQIPETSGLVAAARAAGAVAASSFGAGFGGSVWALVADGDGEPFAGDWVARYAQRFPEAASRALAMPVVASGAARRVDPARLS